MIENISKYLAAIYRQSRAQIEKASPEREVKMQHSDLLLYLYNNPGSMQKQIAHSMAMDPSLLSKDMKKLVAKKLVHRRRGADRRGYQVYLTEHVQEVAEALTADLIAWWDKFFAEHPDIDAKNFVQGLDAVYHVFQEKFPLS